MEEQYAVGEQQGQHGISNENNDDAVLLFFSTILYT